MKAKEGERSLRLFESRLDQIINLRHGLCVPAVEPVIGHAKHDHRMLRNYLKGPGGDGMNALPAACG